jgi:hypothetical protein
LSNQKEGIANDVIAALLALTAILAAFQYRTLSKFSILPPGRAYVNLETFIDTVHREVILDGIDGMLCFLLLVPVLYILIVEVKHRKFTGLLTWVFSDERRTVLALALTSLVSVRYYFAPGALSWAGDAPQHISYLDITSEILSNFELPIWTNYFGAGSPFLQFYGFLYFLIAGALNLVVGDVNLTAKLILGLSHAASGIGVYFLCRILLGSRRAAFLAGLGYVLCFWHAQQVIVMGRHPVGLFYALLPWTYVFLERSLRARDWHRHAVSGGICHTMLVFTHPGYGLYATVFLSLYGLLRSIELRSLATAYRGAAVVGIGLILSAPQTLPMAVERATTRLSLGGSPAATKTPTLQHLLGWSNYRFSIFPLPAESQHWYGGYLGLSLVVIAVAGIVFTIQRRLRPGPRYLAPFGCVCIAFLLPFVSSSSLLEHVPLIPNFSGGRYLLFTVFFLCVSVGVGARFLSAPCFGRGTSRQFTILLGLVLLDLGPRRFSSLTVSHWLRSLPWTQRKMANSTISGISIR